MVLINCDSDIPLQRKIIPIHTAKFLNPEYIYILVVWLTIVFNTAKCSIFEKNI